MKRSFQAALLFGASILSANAQVLLQGSWTSFEGAPSLSIPDNNATGIADTRSLLTQALEILEVRIWLRVEGDYDGDLYVTIRHNDAETILLNRPGRSATTPFGYDTGGMNVTFQDNAVNGDIHVYQSSSSYSPVAGSTLTGAWQPDGRDVDPNASVTTSGRTSFLATFKGKDASGDWTLFAADLSAGGTTRIVGWGLQVNVVPEPAEISMITTFSLGGIFLFRKIRSKK